MVLAARATASPSLLRIPALAALPLTALICLAELSARSPTVLTLETSTLTGKYLRVLVPDIGTDQI